MPRRSICVLGGTGFVGRSLCQQLVAANHRVRVLTRRYATAGPLRVLPTLEVVEGNVHDPRDLTAALAGQDAVVNLVAVLHDRPHGAFAQCHVDSPKKVFAAARAAGVRRVLHMSALGASDLGPSAYLRTRGRGEMVAQAAMAEFDVTIFRPSVIFGAGDRFTNTFARLVRLAPLVPLAGGGARFQPVWVEDVAAALATTLGRPASHGQILELGGPQVLTLAEVVQRVAAVVGARARVWPLPAPLAWLQATLLGLWPGRQPLMTRDNLASLSVDNVCSGAWPAVLGFAPTAFGAEVERYLGDRNPQSRYEALRHRAGR